MGVWYESEARQGEAEVVQCPMCGSRGGFVSARMSWTDDPSFWRGYSVRCAVGEGLRRYSDDSAVFCG